MEILLWVDWLPLTFKTQLKILIILVMQWFRSIPLGMQPEIVQGRGGGEGFLEQIRVEKHSIYKTRKKSPAWKLSGVFPEILLKPLFNWKI